MTRCPETRARSVTLWQQCVRRLLPLPVLGHYARPPLPSSATAVLLVTPVTLGFSLVGLKHFLMVVKPMTISAILSVCLWVMCPFRCAITLVPPRQQPRSTSVSE